MRMREALFLSSKDATRYTRTSNGLDYLIRVEEGTEEYNPSFFFADPGPGPHFRAVYCTTVSLVKDSVVHEPHQQYRCFDIDQSEDFLHVWGIDTEAGWKPEEEQSPPIVSSEPAKSQ